MPAFSRDTLSPPHTADAITSAPARIDGWTPLLQRLPAPQPSHGISLPSKAASVADARRFAARLLAEWGLDELAADAALLLSELVTNAIVHVPRGAGDVRLVLGRTPDHLVAQVIDAGGCLPLCGEAGPDSEGGRGMWLVEQIAAQWGHHATATGKTVWFTLPLPRPASAG